MSEETSRAAKIDAAIKAADAKKRADEQAAADAAAMMDALISRLDSISSPMDAYDEAEAAAKADAKCEEDKPEVKEKKMEADSDDHGDREGINASEIGREKGDPVRLAADARADSTQFRDAKQTLIYRIQSDAQRAYNALGMEPRCP